MRLSSSLAVRLRSSAEKAGASDHRGDRATPAGGDRRRPRRRGCCHGDHNDRRIGNACEQLDRNANEKPTRATISELALVA
jgi:hypothetical protein